MTLRWTAFPLHPETPEEGRSLEDLFAGRLVDIPAMLAKLNATADSLGLPFGTRTMTYNSRRALELGKWAEARGYGEAFHMAVFKAYFAEGLNIALPEVLVDLAQGCGLDPGQARQALGERSFRQAVDDDWARSRRLHITAVPTFKMEARQLVGAQPYEALERLALSAGAKEHS